MNGVQLLQEGLDITQGDRQDQHGDWVENHERIAQFWSVYLGMRLKGSDVTKMMALLKIARDDSGSLNPDDFRDGAVYMARTYDSRIAEQTLENATDVEYADTEQELSYLFDRKAAQ